MATKRTNAADSQSSNKKRKTKKKTKAPTSFLDATTLLQVVDFPSRQPFAEHDTTKSEVVSDVVKELFLDRFVKEITKPFAPDRNDNSQFVIRNGKLQKAKQSHAGKKTESIWNQRIIVGTNQCLRILDAAMSGSTAQKPLLCVCARDVYPPTMLTQVPIQTKKLSIPLVILGGKASTELGKAMGFRKASIAIILESRDTDESHSKIDSFCSYARTLVLVNS